MTIVEGSSGQTRKRTKTIAIPCGCRDDPFIKPLLTCDCSPLVMKVRSRASSVMSGASTPGGGPFKSLSEGDLRKADAALSQVNGAMNGK